MRSFGGVCGRVGQRRGSPGDVLSGSELWIAAAAAVVWCRWRWWCNELSLVIRLKFTLVGLAAGEGKAKYIDGDRYTLKDVG